MSRTRVVLDLRSVHPGLSGIGRYAMNLCLSLEDSTFRSRLLLLTSPGGDAMVSSFASSPRIVVNAQPQSYDEMGLPGLLRDVDAILYHTPMFVLPAIRACTYLATFHDVIPLARPDLTPQDFRLFFQGFAPRAIRRAGRLIAVSHYSKSDLSHHMDVASGRIDVVHEAVSPQFQPILQGRAEGVLSRYELRAGYFLSVGALDRRKNLTLILDALQSFQNKVRTIPEVVFIGGPSGDGFALESEISQRGLERKVRILGRVPDNDLPALYSSALALVFPSFYEGFGLPVVEAMACGTPVIASQRTSIPEIAGDAALLINPEAAGDLAAAMARLLEDGPLRKELRSRGLAQARRYSLKAQATGIEAVYEQALREAA